MPWSITLPRVTTSPRRRSITWQRMLPHPTTPRLLSITLFSATYCTDTPNYFSVPSCYTKTVEYFTEVAKYFSAPIYSTRTEAAKYYASQLATQKLLSRATLNLNTTLMLQSTTPRSFLYLATTPQPLSTTPKKPPITQPRTLPGIPHRGI